MRGPSPLHDGTPPARAGTSLSARLAALAVSALCAACVPSTRPLGVGTDCELNSQCAAPLVCRLGRCRNECATSQDCDPGLSCVLDERKLGVCQLAYERSCALQTDCPSVLVCRFRQCVNACETDRDCVGGARCTSDPAGNACLDPAETACASDGECGVAQFCISGRCRQQCFSSRDCRRDHACLAGVCISPTDASVDSGSLEPDAP